MMPPILLVVQQNGGEVYLGLFIHHTRKTSERNHKHIFSIQDWNALKRTLNKCVSLTKVLEIVRSSSAQVTTGHWLCSADKMVFL
jgi:hypothetical protein